MSSVITSHKPRLFQVVDWRLVAAIGLPLWAFLIGFVLAHRTASALASPEPNPMPAGVVQAVHPQLSPPTAASVEQSPPPHEVVIHTEFQPVPIIVPVPTPGEPNAAVVQTAPDEFKLPPSEFLPADRCKTFDTKIRFHAGLPEAATEAKLSKKLLLVLHISGNFDDPGFT
jgi:hypothetical protein